MSDAVKFALAFAAAAAIATVPLWGPRLATLASRGGGARGPWWAETSAENPEHCSEEHEYYEETSTVTGVVEGVDGEVGPLSVRTPSGERVDVLIRGVWRVGEERISWGDLVEELSPGMSVEVLCHYSETWDAWMATELRYDGTRASRFGG